MNLKGVVCGKMAVNSFKLIQNAKVWVFRKIQDIYYVHNFKIKEEMTEKLKPNPPPVKKLIT